MHIGFEFPNAILEHYLEQPRFKLKRKTITLRRLSTLMFLIEHDHVTTYGKPFAWASFRLSNPYNPFISNTSTYYYYHCLNGAPPQRRIQHHPAILCTCPRESICKHARSQALEHF